VRIAALLCHKQFLFIYAAKIKLFFQLGTREILFSFNYFRSTTQKEKIGMVRFFALSLWSGLITKKVKAMSTKIAK
jgi:hypothetical protein